MKKVIVSVAMFAFAFSTMAGNGNTPAKGDKYCVKKKDGVTKVIYKGDAITTNVTLKDGTVLKTDGTVVRKDGTVYTLNEGQCIYEDGKTDLK